MYNVRLINVDKHDSIVIEKWINDSFPRVFEVMLEVHPPAQTDIFIIYIRSSYDWVKVNRLKKEHVQSKFIILMDESRLKTASIAVKLKVQELLIKPLRKSILIKALRNAMNDLDDLPIMRENFMKRLVNGEINTEDELCKFQLYAKIDDLPNIICLVQGHNGAQNFIENQEGRRILRSHLRSVIKNHLSHWVKEVYFISYSHYLAVLFHSPYIYKSVREWEQLRFYLLKLINEINKEYGITLHAGVGSVTNTPLQLNKPFEEAKQALDHSLKSKELLCFFEELTVDDTLQKCVEYISNNFHGDLSIKKVASQVHLSHTYFSRLFKKQFGISFVEYVTNVRIKRAKWLLGHTNETIESIAAQVGFNTPNYFSSIFKKHAGVSPSEYRESHLLISE